MNPHLAKNIKSTYLKLSKPKVDFRLPDLKSYYKIREDLSHYRYDERVMEDLLLLNLENLDNQKRIDRYRLFRQTVGFIWDYKNDPERPFNRANRIFQQKPSARVLDLFFQLFQRVSTDKFEVVFKSQSKSPFWDLLEVLTKSKLSNNHWEWILENAFSSPKVRIVIEQTSQRNKKIADWVSTHWDCPEFSAQRARYAAHLVDWDKEFEINSDTIIKDCITLNESDQKYIDWIIDEYNQEELLRRVEIDLHNRFGANSDEEGRKYKELEKLKDDFLDMDYENTEEDVFSAFTLYSEKFGRILPSKFVGFDIPYCFLPHTKRLYPIPQKKQKQGKVEFPDFERGRQDLINNIEAFTCKYNLWAVAESRLSSTEKFKRMKKYYRDDLIYTWLHIAKIKKIPSMLKWIMGKNK